MAFSSVLFYNYKLNSQFNTLDKKIKLKVKKFPIKIDYNGDWFYNNSQIKRKPLIKLFSSVLKRDNKGNFYLETPVEKGQIEVEDAPFVITSHKILGKNDKQKIVFYTNLEEEVVLNKNNPLIYKKKSGNYVPYVFLEKKLEARILRPVYYQLISDLKKKKEKNYTLKSQGCSFKLK